MTNFDRLRSTDPGRDQNQRDEPDRDDIASAYFDLLPYEPYPVQEEALLAYFADDGYSGVLVCAPTGTGKTLIAEAAVYEALRTRRRMYYTTPLIALTDQKLDELRQSAIRWGFSADDVGLVTGNRAVNPDAPVLVVVAEILLNRLLSETLDSDVPAEDASPLRDVQSVVMDEFHSFNDRERGIVWELSLALLPPHVRTMLLSATVGNALEFTSWLQRAHNRRLKLVVGTERKVPLQYHWIGDEILVDQAVKMADGDEADRRTPGLVFCFSRSQCWTTADLLRGKPLIDKERQKAIAERIENEDMSQGVGPKLKTMLLRGVGVHHAGVLPKYRRIVEQLFQAKLLAFCVCTETLAAGINLPARSVILPTILKGPKDKKKLIDVAQAQQIFGRAGRPQYDDRGYVFAFAHEDDVKLHAWREKYDAIPEDTKDPGLLKARKSLKKKMPKRRTGETYWSEAQFEQLQNASAQDLQSKGRWPWRLLANLLHRDSHVQPIRDMIGKRLLRPGDLDAAKVELNRMLFSLWSGDYVELHPPPKQRSADGSPTPGDAKSAASKSGNGAESAKDLGSEVESTPAATGGLFGALLDQVRQQEADAKSSDDQALDRQPDQVENVAADEATPEGKPETASRDFRHYDISDYKPDRATPKLALERLLPLKSVNPLFGVFVADLLALAEPLERVAVMESILQLPFTVARYARVPGADELPPGVLTRETLDPQLLTRGLATPEELGQVQEDEDDENDRRRRGMFEEPKVWPLTIGEKVLRLFRDDFPRVEEARVVPVWMVGRLLEFDFNFNSFITTAKLQKEEGLVFRHCLRMILLCDELANVPPRGTTVETWEYWLDDLAERLTQMCTQVDPQSTDEILVDVAGSDLLQDKIGGRRGKA